MQCCPSARESYINFQLNSVKKILMNKNAVFLIMLIFLSSCSSHKPQKNDNREKELMKNIDLLTRESVSEEKKGSAKKNITILLYYDKRNTTNKKGLFS